MAEPATEIAIADADDADDAAEVADVADEPALDELVVLDQLEADLTAVELAVESLERVATEGLGGQDAAAQIAAAVSVERFGPTAAPAADGAHTPG